MKPTTSAALAVLAALQHHVRCTATSNVEGSAYASEETITLKSDGITHDVQILDFGGNVEGYPTFEVVSASGDTSAFEVSFAESIYAFEDYMVRDIH